MRFRATLFLVIVFVVGLFSACSYDAPSVESSAHITSEVVSDFVIDESETVEDYPQVADTSAEPVLLSVFTKCEHTETIKRFSFQPQTSRAMSYMQSECKECYEVLYTNGFYDNPKDLSYLDVMNSGEHFVEGDYYTVEAKVVYNFFANDLKVKCEVERDGVCVGFTITFTEEYKEASGLLQEGEVITFRGKAAPEGRLYWTDCELITD